jgi:hypothetical protein
LENELAFLLFSQPRLFYLLDYGFLPQNVSEVGGEKKRKKIIRDPKVQIITIGHLLQFEDGSLAHPVIVCVEPMYNRI